MPSTTPPTTLPTAAPTGMLFDRLGAAVADCTVVIVVVTCAAKVLLRELDLSADTFRTTGMLVALTWGEEDSGDKAANVSYVIPLLKAVLTKGYGVKTRLVLGGVHSP